ncbi:MAG TPA: Gfo/Idh/MocA family oxidoreductase [Verrucomicrobiae bacterium]|nr:Gfo/Idh/MocA family oxidoreductase [Verrucomicrobiae bacterium]
MNSESNRRKFIGAAAGAAAFTIVPRHVLGGPNQVPPSDKITLAYIGTGTQGLREMVNLLPIPEIQIVSVCDPNRYATGYGDWSKEGLLRQIRNTLGKPDWQPGAQGAIPGGRDVGKDVVDTYYANQRAADQFRGVTAYADFRELVEKEKDLDAVKIMTPDHLHGVISMAAMRRRKHVIMHKPIANRLKEAQAVIETARRTGVSTHFMPWDSNGNMEPVLAWIKDGAIGTLREVHNWTNRPVWPQYPTMPADTPPVPEGFDWDLWLGPEAARPYHPTYTHMVFRGWYDFGGGSMADMGHYSLWTVFNALELSAPTSVEPMLSHHCVLRDSVSSTVKNDFSFPAASIVRFKYPSRGPRPAIDLIWYEGGIKPPTPEELGESGDLPAEGMMFVGDKGKILSGFRVESPRLVQGTKMTGSKSETVRARREPGETPRLSPGLQQWVEACKGGKQSPGAFINAGPISEAVNLYAVALRTGKRLVWDAAAGRITNIADANRYLAREYRKGWDLESV